MNAPAQLRVAYTSVRVTEPEQWLIEARRNTKAVRIYGDGWDGEYHVIDATTVDSSHGAERVYMLRLIGGAA